MEWIIWVIVIVVIVGIVWWLLNRNTSGNAIGTSTSSESDVSTPQATSAGTLRSEGALSGGGTAASAEAAATTGTAGTAGFVTTPGPKPPTTTDDSLMEAGKGRVTSAAAAIPGTPGGDVDDWDEELPVAAASPAAKPATEPDAEEARAEVEDKAEWEAQWSEAASTPHAEGVTGKETSSGQATSKTHATAAAVPVHHPEYTEPHAPTLPGAESAAAEDTFTSDAVPETGPRTGIGSESAVTTGTDSTPRSAPAGAVSATGAHAGALSEGDAETMQAAASSAATEATASHTAEPAGHLATDKPYGEGSASPGPDGSGPEGYTVKGNAQSMIYHDETSPEYEETTAEVWFESAAHAEAAGFRAPRRSRH
jgi:hypothetical protein